MLTYADRANPFRASISARCKELGGDVHFKLGSLYENGHFGEPDAGSALFHVTVAARLGDPQAVFVLLYQ